MKNLKIYDFIIIGAGASGLMCASLLPKKYKILLIDANPKIGEKIKISGGGNCNITNEHISTSDFLGDSEFLKPTLDSYTYKDILNFFENVEFEKRKNSQYFSKFGSQKIIDFFHKKTSHCDFSLSTFCQEVKKDKDIFVCICKDKIFKSKRLIVASGGLSFPKLNASDIGFKIAKSFSLKVKTPSPALVGLTLQKEEFWMKELSGISLNAKIDIDGKIFEDDMLFSHRGISGPLILNTSLFWEKGKISVNFLSQNKVKFYLQQNSKKQITSVLPLPKRFIKAFLSHINIEDKRIENLKTKEIISLEKLNNYEFAPAGNFGYTKAEVTKGGVKTDEINPITYESKKIKDLYFIGEVLDITGRLGGYNFYFAFACANMLSSNES